MRKFFCALGMSWIGALLCTSAGATVYQNPCSPLQSVQSNWSDALCNVKAGQFAKLNEPASESTLENAISVGDPGSAHSFAATVNALFSPPNSNNFNIRINDPGGSLSDILIFKSGDEEFWSDDDGSKISLKSISHLSDDTKILTTITETSGWLDIGKLIVDSLCKTDCTDAHVKLDNWVFAFSDVDTLAGGGGPGGPGSTPIPAALPLFIGGLSALGLARRWRKQTA